mmetsp:Transcript_16712/g.43350  ORF Transcript_16712/g.43350 Transcript_16712/m.43350 type:complete len:896 (-) Transcript_16712:246-2933(-)
MKAAMPARVPPPTKPKPRKRARALPAPPEPEPQPQPPAVAPRRRKRKDVPAPPPPLVHRAWGEAAAAAAAAAASSASRANADDNNNDNIIGAAALPDGTLAGPRQPPPPTAPRTRARRGSGERTERAVARTLPPTPWYSITAMRSPPLNVEQQLQYAVPEQAPPPAGLAAAAPAPAAPPASVVSAGEGPRQPGGGCVPPGEAGRAPSTTATTDNDGVARTAHKRQQRRVQGRDRDRDRGAGRGRGRGPPRPPALTRRNPFATVVAQLNSGADATDAPPGHNASPTTTTLGPTTAAAASAAATSPLPPHRADGVEEDADTVSDDRQCHSLSAQLALRATDGGKRRHRRRRLPPRPTTAKARIKGLFSTHAIPWTAVSRPTSAYTSCPSGDLPDVPDACARVSNADATLATGDAGWEEHAGDMSRRDACRGRWRRKAAGDRGRRAVGRQVFGAGATPSSSATVLSPTAEAAIDAAHEEPAYQVPQLARQSNALSPRQAWGISSDGEAQRALVPAPYDYGPADLASLQAASAGTAATEGALAAVNGAASFDEDGAIAENYYEYMGSLPGRALYARASQHDPAHSSSSDSKATPPPRDSLVAAEMIAPIVGGFRCRNGTRHNIAQFRTVAALHQRHDDAMMLGGGGADEVVGSVGDAAAGSGGYAVPCLVDDDMEDGDDCVFLAPSVECASAPTSTMPSQALGEQLRASGARSDPLAPPPPPRPPRFSVAKDECAHYAAAFSVGRMHTQPEVGRDGYLAVTGGKQARVELGATSGGGGGTTSTNPSKSLHEVPVLPGQVEADDDDTDSLHSSPRSRRSSVAAMAARFASSSLRRKSSRRGDGRGRASEPGLASPKERERHGKKAKAFRSRRAKSLPHACGGATYDCDDDAVVRRRGLCC